MTTKEAIKSAVTARDELPLAASIDWPTQKFHVSHYHEDDFKSAPNNPHVAKRDLGMVAATGGMVEAACFRRPLPFDPAACSPRHYHAVKFQLVYVLKGWVKLELEGQGVQTMCEGSCWIQPAGVKHQILEYSQGHEVLEINIPGHHETVYDAPTSRA